MKAKRIGQAVAAVGVILAVASALVCPMKVCSVGTSAIIFFAGAGVWYWKRKT